MLNVTKEMQIKTTMRYYFTRTRMTIVKKDDSKSLWIWRNWNPPYIAGSNVKCGSHFRIQFDRFSEVKYRGAWVAVS